MEASPVDYVGIEMEVDLSSLLLSLPGHYSCQWANFYSSILFHSLTYIL